ncbi:transmembrane protein 26-like [Antedon mediterranea]|uniref:transmembrane protein 26-like n=1 Tax=Antedon mediterranea TaxID=105859 RepID=UPI003AF7CF56
MKCTKATKLLLARGIYAAHALAAVTYTSREFETVDIVVVSACMLALLIETIVTIKSSSGEWKWFLPSVPIYLCIILWCVWKLEMTLLDKRLSFRETNDTCVASCKGFEVMTCDANGQVEEDNKNSKVVEECESITTKSALIQQTIMLVLIGCRWILPKGEMTRDQLSQLLLVFIGMAADMLEFSSESLKLKDTACSKTLICFVLIIWSWSLLQFAIGLTATKARKTRVAGTGMGTRSAVTKICHCCETEIWAIMTTVVMQDGPYLTMRLYLLFKYQIVDRQMLFFTCKNALLVFLQSYRLYVILCTKEKDEDLSTITDEEKAEMAMTVESGDDEKNTIEENKNEMKVGLCQLKEEIETIPEDELVNGDDMKAVEADENEPTTEKNNGGEIMTVEADNETAENENGGEMITVEEKNDN